MHYLYGNAPLVHVQTMQRPFLNDTKYIFSTALCEEVTFVFNIEASGKLCVLTDIYVIIFNRQGVITEKKLTTYKKKLSQVFLFNYSLQNGINLFRFLGLSVFTKYTSLYNF